MTHTANISHAIGQTLARLEVADVDRVDQFRLGRIALQLRDYLSMWERETCPEMRALRFSRNWHGPAVESLVFEAEQILGEALRRAA